MRRWPLFVLVFTLAACSSPEPVPTATLTVTLRSRVTASPTPSPVPPRLSTPLATAGPTPTPLIHVVERGDTLLGIALTYGVELADLLLANPDVNPRFLSVGTGLLIPDTGVQSAVATATPQPLTLSPARCYPQLDGGLWCLLLARSPGSQPVEAVIAWVNLIDDAGRVVQTEPAFSPVNLLRSDSALPLAAYFAPPVPEHVAASVVLASALQANQVEARYPALTVQIDRQIIASDGSTAQVAGSVRLAQPEASLDSGLRVVALALDGEGELAGYRVWERDRAEVPPQGVEFELTVPSLGPPIAELQVLAEGR